MPRRSVGTTGVNMIDFQRFEALRPEARGVVFNLLEQSQDARRPFERFMFLWMSFNGWMNCVTNGDFEARMIEELASDLALAAAFERIVLGGDNAGIIHEFAEWWPIFDVKSIRKVVGIDGLYQHQYRDEFLEAHSANPKVKRKPERWVAGHRPRWEDLVWAIYQVRCNLFHGDKASSNPGDVEIVRLAHGAMLICIEQLELYRLGPPEAPARRQRRTG